MAQASPFSEIATQALGQDIGTAGKFKADKMVNRSQSIPLGAGIYKHDQRKEAEKKAEEAARKKEEKVLYGDMMLIDSINNEEDANYVQDIDKSYYDQLSNQIAAGDTKGAQETVREHNAWAQDFVRRSELNKGVYTGRAGNIKTLQDYYDKDAEQAIDNADFLGLDGDSDFSTTYFRDYVGAGSNISSSKYIQSKTKGMQLQSADKLKEYTIDKDGQKFLRVKKFTESGLFLDENGEVVTSPDKFRGEDINKVFGDQDGEKLLRSESLVKGDDTFKKWFAENSERFYNTESDKYKRIEKQLNRLEKGYSIGNDVFDEAVMDDDIVAAFSEENPDYMQGKTAGQLFDEKGRELLMSAQRTKSQVSVQSLGKTTGDGSGFGFGDRQTIVRDLTNQTLQSFDRVLSSPDGQPIFLDKDKKNTFLEKKGNVVFYKQKVKNDDDQYEDKVLGEYKLSNREDLERLSTLVVPKQLGKSWNNTTTGYNDEALSKVFDNPKMVAFTEKLTDPTLTGKDVLEVVSKELKDEVDGLSRPERIKAVTDRLGPEFAKIYFNEDLNDVVKFWKLLSANLIEEETLKARESIDIEDVSRTTDEILSSGNGNEEKKKSPFRIEY